IRAAEVGLGRRRRGEYDPHRPLTAVRPAPMSYRLLLSITLALVLWAASAQGDEPPPAHERHLSELVESIVRASVPRAISNAKHWNKHEEVFAGVKVRGDGLKVRISKRKQRVRHGFWRRYDVTLIDPERTLKVRISDVQPQGGGRWTYTVTAEVRAQVVTRFEQWSLGVKLFNTSSEADATLRLPAGCALHVGLEQDETAGPLIVFAPEVKRVDLALPNLDVKKVGELRGDLASDLGDGLEEVVEDLLQTQQGSVRKRANKEIARREDDLRIPLGEFLGSHAQALWLMQ